MRDIDRYEQVYLQDNHDFERYQVRYRRKKRGFSHNCG